MQKTSLFLAISVVVGILAVLNAKESSRVPEIVQIVSTLSIDEHIAAASAVSRSLHERLLAVSPELKARWKDFSSQKDQGINKLINRGILGDTEGMRGGGAYFSFISLSNSYDSSPQLELQGFAFGSGFYGGSHGIVARLSSADITQTTTDDCPGDLVAKYADPVEELWKLQRRFTDTGSLAAEVDKVYAVRWASYNEGDTLAAFQVVAKDERTVTIAWRVLTRFPMPRQRR